MLAFQILSIVGVVLASIILIYAYNLVGHSKIKA